MSGLTFAQLASLRLDQLDEDTLLVLNQRITAELLKRQGVRNSTRLAVHAVRNRLNSERSGRARKESDLMDAGWLDLYPDRGEDRRFYVYVHVKPNDVSTTVEYEEGKTVHLPGAPFYVGKGTGLRAFEMSRNEGHGAELRSMLANGVQVKSIAHIVCDGLTEAEAFRLESKLIYLYGTRFETDFKGQLVNLEIPKRPSSLHRFARAAGLEDAGLSEEKSRRKDNARRKREESVRKVVESLKDVPKTEGGPRLAPSFNFAPV